MAGYWGDGFSKLFKFGMQMVLVLLTGYVLALTPAVQSMLTGLTRHTSTPRQALVLTIVVSFVCYYLNWGFGMVAGAILAREMGRRVAVHFPLIVAAAYGGELVRGPSSSIPLVIATPDHFMEDAIGIVPVSETLYSGWNIALTITLLVLLVIFFLLQKQPERIVRLDDSGDDRPDTQADATGHSPAECIENSRWPTLFLGLLAAAYLIAQVVNQGFSINLNTIILIFLALGLILHRNSVAYLKATEKAVTAARGIIVQFPLYAGHRRNDDQLGAGDPVLRSDHCHRDAGKLSSADVPLRRPGQLLHPLRGRSVGDSGADHDGSRSGPGGRPRPDHHGLHLGRWLDQPDPAVLGPAPARGGRAVGSGHHGLPAGVAADFRCRHRRHFHAARRRRLTLPTPGPAGGLHIRQDSARVP